MCWHSFLQLGPDDSNKFDNGARLKPNHRVSWPLTSRGHRFVLTFAISYGCYYDWLAQPMPPLSLSIPQWFAWGLMAHEPRLRTKEQVQNIRSARDRSLVVSLTHRLPSLSLSLCHSTFLLSDRLLSDLQLSC